MKCMYCGNETKNKNHVCNACEDEAKRLDALQQCTSDSLREKVARFIDERPETTNFHGMKYYTYEDALVEFIANILKENQED